MGNLTVKESGEMVNFISPNVSKITSFKVHFSPKQEGTGDPSPDNVREITGWNGVEGYGCGKNLVPWIKTNLTVQGDHYNSFANWSELWEIPKRISYTYSVFIDNSNCSTDGGARVWLRDIDNSKYTHVVSGKKIKAGEKGISAVTLNFSNLPNDYYAYWGLELYQNAIASMPIVYESNQETVTISDWSSNIETVYGGYVDLVSGELVVDMVSTTFGQMTGWSKSVDFNYFVTNEKISDAINVSADIKNVASSIYPSAIISNTNSELGISLTKGRIRVRQANMSMAVDAWLAEVKDKQFCYKLATPITHQLTPQQLSTLKGQNNFWSNADYVEIEYELTETFDIQKAKRKIILNQPHIESASGDLVTFDTDMKGKLKECKVYFSPVQEGEGDPSPDNVREIAGWNGVNIYKAGQNLIPENIPVQFYRVYPSGGHFIESGTAFSTFFIPVPKGKICLARTTRSLLPYGALCDELPTVGANAFNAITMTNRNSYIFDNSEGHKYFAITVNRSVEVNSDWDSFLDTEPRLTISDTVQPYTIPTNISIHSIDWTDSVGTIDGGYVDLASGELVQTWYGFILDGVNNYLNSGPKLLDNGLATIFDHIGSGGLSNLPVGPYNHYENQIICDKYPVKYRSDSEGIVTNSGRLYIRLILDPSKLEDVSSTSAIRESMIKWQQENPLQIVYSLETPIIYQLTPQQILTLKGINNVYSDTNGQMEIKYWKH